MGLKIRRSACDYLAQPRRGEGRAITPGMQKEVDTSHH